MEGTTAGTVDCNTVRATLIDKLSPSIDLAALHSSQYFLWISEKTLGHCLLGQFCGSAGGCLRMRLVF